MISDATGVEAVVQSLSELAATTSVGAAFCWRQPFERMTFARAVAVIGSGDGVVRNERGGRQLTRAGEHALMDAVGGFVWVTHFDHVSVPFYQAFADGDETLAANADLHFGIGEVVGSGQRHIDGDSVRKALAMHQVPEEEYQWYVELKDNAPMLTSGFGLGVERFLLWVLRHDDIRDIPLVSRIDEPAAWPARVDRP